MHKARESVQQNQVQGRGDFGVTDVFRMAPFLGLPWVSWFSSFIDSMRCPIVFQ